MAVSFTVVCHTCKQKMNMAHYTESHVASVFADWGMDEHESHHVSVIADTSSEMTDEEWNVIKSYTAVKPIE